MARRGKLTAAKVSSNKLPDGSYFDGNGLRLQIKGKSKTWTLRFQLNGKSREMGLGSFKDVSLADARSKADEMLSQAKAGIDPIAKRKADLHHHAADNVWTFDKCAAAYIKAHSPGWKNQKHIQQWKNTLKQYASPVLGNLPVSEIDTGLVLQVIEPIWHTRTETASRVRGRVEKILTWATVRGYREGFNPAVWVGNLEALLPAKAKVSPVKHHAAMEYADIAAFMDVLKQKTSISGKAMLFTILTACRTSEVIKAQWSEIDLDARVWTIPADRMKMTREHRVPLSDQAITLLESLPGMAGWLFPSIHYGRHLSNMAMLKMLKKDLGYPALTVHGFRSTFTDWVAEVTSYSVDIREAALAHKMKDKTIAAYQRGDLLEKRRRLMQSWADYCDQARASADVVAIGRAS